MLSPCEGDCSKSVHIWNPGLICLGGMVYHHVRMDVLGDVYPKTGVELVCAITAPFPTPPAVSGTPSCIMCLEKISTTPQIFSCYYL